MNGLLIACQLLPLLGLLLIMTSDGSENKITAISVWLSRAMGLSVASLLTLWAIAGFPQYEYQWFTLYQQDDYSFPILFYLDQVGAAYLFCIWTIFAIIVKYCRVYLHREQGYKRFFQTIFGFVFGLNLIVLSGSIDMLFAGWEIVGISSFLLIAFLPPPPTTGAKCAAGLYDLPVLRCGFVVGRLDESFAVSRKPTL